MLVAFAASAAGLWLLRDVILTVFAGGLLAVIVRCGALAVKRRLGLSTRVAVLGLFSVGIVVGLGLAVLFGTVLANQASDLRRRVPVAEDLVKQLLGHIGLGNISLESFAGHLLPHSAGIVGEATTLVSGGLGVLASFLLVLFLGLYWALEPEIYRGIAVRLVAPARRERTGAVLDEAAAELTRWFFCQTIIMGIVGVATGVGLWAMGVPLAALLGVLGALFEFIPIVGSFGSIIIASVVGLTQSPTTGLYAFLYVVALQQVQGNIVTPYVQQRGVNLPPVITLVSVVAMSTLFGLPGVVLAVPVVIAGRVFVKRLYVEGLLESPEAQSRPRTAHSP